MHKILLLEDDKNLRDTLIRELEESSYIITATDKSEEVITYTYAENFDLYLFNVNVIGIDGFELLALLREAGDKTPAIFLSSKNTIADIEMGFENGANDYVKKPFDIDELLIRIKYRIVAKKQYIIADNITYFPETYKVLHGDKRIVLHIKDAQILEYFLKHPNQIVTKEEILSAVYNDAYISDTTYRGYINKLKSTIGRSFFRNIRGQGYIYETL